MGIEYHLRFSAPDAVAIEKVLRHQPDLRASAAPGTGFDIGFSGGSWPQATVQIESGGVYFCDHCSGGGRAILGAVVADLVSAFGPVVVEEL